MREEKQTKERKSYRPLWVQLMKKMKLSVWMTSKGCYSKKKTADVQNWKMIAYSNPSLHITETTSFIETMEHTLNIQYHKYPYINSSLDNRVRTEVNEDISFNQGKKDLDEVQRDLMDYPYVTDLDRKVTCSMDSSENHISRPSNYRGLASRGGRLATVKQYRASLN